ncbi:MAG: metallophosphoesterase [Verrucomicrobia bacterium]|nr:metallophosphoesterase [Verrucomicrobiota bacterium]
MSHIRLIRSKISLVILAGVVVGWCSSLHAQSGAHGVSAANINVVQNDTANTTNSVTVTATLAINDLRIRPGSNRGDYNVQVGPEFSDDYLTGVLMSSVAENGRNNGEASYPGKNYCTSAINYSRTGANTGAYYVPVFNAPAGAEYNINVAAAFFPYTNWLGGLARNSAGTANGANNLLTGSPGLVLGTHFIDNGSGVSTVNLASHGFDSRTDGVLLVTHGDNAKKYALSQVNSVNGTWNVFIKDNGTDSNIYQQGPVAFVFIPKTNTTVVSGRFSGDGTRLMYSGATPSFNITNTSVGMWRLTIPGQTPVTGTLIISPEGGETSNRDNIVSYQADGDGWIIQSRDLPGTGLQTPGTQPVASFVFIPVTARTTLVAPADRAPNQVKSPTLQVNVTNATPGNVTVQFYGRESIPEPSPDFTIAVLPDTQYYVSSRNGGLPQMFIAQTEWIVTNRVSRNIAYVAHLGDITQDGDLLSNGGSNVQQWLHSTNAMYRLENPTRTLLQFGIPYGVAVGNHDQEPIGSATGTTTFYNQFFGISHFQGRPYYAGHYGTNNDNHFDFFSAGGLEFIALYFEFDNDANADVLAWGNAVLQTNTHRRAIVVSHHIGNTQTPVVFRAQGQAIYDALKGNTNLFMMLAGHVTGEGSRVDTFNGNTVRTFVADYQGWTNGGNGYMRIMEFSPRRNQVVVQTYSPWVDEYQTGPNSEFYFPYSMQSQAMPNGYPFTLVGTSSNVPSGGAASVVWSNRETETEYEWFVVVTDASGNTTTGPLWQFTTATNAPPSASHRLLNVIGDSATNIVLLASDPNGDPLTFQTNSWPTYGVNLNFNTNTGAITYQPAHGFRGFDQFSYHASDGSATTAVVSVILNVVSPPDANANGLPDAWEAKYGITDPNADDDGDGHSNRDEYIANTNPKDATSVLRFNQASRAGNGSVILSWSSVGGTRYRVQYSSADANGNFNGVFTDLVRSVSDEMGFAPRDTPSTHTFVDDFTLTGGAGANAARYYRIKVVQ